MHPQLLKPAAILTDFKPSVSALVGTICTYVDGAAADPLCGDQYDYTIGALQGKPAIAKGDHIVRTTYKAISTGQEVFSWQIVYTLYQH